MPKQRGPLRLQGGERNGENVYWQGKNGNYHVRQKQKPGIHKDQPELKANYTTIGEKNSLAGKIGRLLKTYAPHDSEKGTYQRLKQVLQKDPVNGRYLQLKRFERADGHTKKKLVEEMTIPAFSIAVNKNKATVSFDIENHPRPGKLMDHYFFRVILVLWNNKDDHYSEQAQRIQWIRMDAELPLCYDLVFDKPKDSREYLLICCLERAERPAESWITNSYIHIVQVGSFNVDDVAAYDAYLAERRAPKEDIRRNAQEEKAVGPVVRGKVTPKNNT